MNALELADELNNNLIAITNGQMKALDLPVAPLIGAVNELRRLHEVEKEYRLFLSVLKNQIELLPERSRT